MNILQEFMESIYREMETQIYSRFNSEMRRMVLKFKETERLVTVINTKITDHYDLFEQERLHKQQRAQLEK